MRICFEELRRSQETSPEPNFLILLGNRYGWRPLPEVISVEEFEKLIAAAEQIQNQLSDTTQMPTASQAELLKWAVAVLEDWYLLDENARPFGDKTSTVTFLRRRCLDGKRRCFRRPQAVTRFDRTHRVMHFSRPCLRSRFHPALSGSDGCS